MKMDFGKMFNKYANDCDNYSSLKNNPKYIPELNCLKPEYQPPPAPDEQKIMMQQILLELKKINKELKKMNKEGVKK